ncbi:hypothetical protein YC2023_093452 [Brassica napus]
MYRSRSKEILVVHVDSGLSPSQIARAIHESIREMHDGRTHWVAVDLLPLFDIYFFLF